MTDHDKLREAVGDLAEELAEFIEQSDPRSATFRVAAARKLQETHDKLADLYTNAKFAGLEE